MLVDVVRLGVLHRGVAAQRVERGGRRKAGAHEGHAFVITRAAHLRSEDTLGYDGVGSAEGRAAGCSRGADAELHEHFTRHAV